MTLNYKITLIKRSSMAPRSVRFGVHPRKLSNVGRHWMGDQNLLYRVPRCFRRHVKPLVPAAFVSTYKSALGPRGGLRPVLLMFNLQGKPVPQQWGH
jgi:hypothetical protein